MNVAAPAKTALLYFASNEPDKWVAKIGIAQSITDPIQAQCHSKGQRIFLPFPLPWNKRGHERYAQVHRLPVRIELPLGMERSRKRRRE